MSWNNFDYPHTRYYENDLTELLDKVKTLIEGYNELVDDINALNEKYDTIDEKVRLAIEKALETTIADLERQVAETNDYIERVASINNQRYQTLLEQFSALSESLDVRLVQIRADFRAADAILDQKFIAITNELQREIDNIALVGPPVYNPVKGIMTDVQTAINDIYNALRTGGISAIDYDNKQLTASAYDALAITAIAYDTNAENILP